MVNLALLQQAIETIEEQHRRAQARVLMLRADEAITRHECAARLQHIANSMQQRINRLIQAMR